MPTHTFPVDYTVPPVGGVLDEAFRQELPRDTLSVTFPFSITLGTRPVATVMTAEGQEVHGPVVGRLMIFGLKCGNPQGRGKNRPKEMVGVLVGAADQLTVTGFPENQEPILGRTFPGQSISGVARWNGGQVTVNLQGGQTVTFPTTLNATAGMRLVCGMDEGDVQGMAKFASWPAQGTRITGTLTAETASSAQAGGPPPPQVFEPVPPPIALPPASPVVPLPPAVSPPPPVAPGGTGSGAGNDSLLLPILQAVERRLFSVEGKLGELLSLVQRLGGAAGAGTGAPGLGALLGLLGGVVPGLTPPLAPSTVPAAPQDLQALLLQQGLAALLGQLTRTQ